VTQDLPIVTYVNVFVMAERRGDEARSVATRPNHPSGTITFHSVATIQVIFYSE
jgi:hypothetical protein